MCEVKRLNLPVHQFVRMAHELLKPRIRPGDHVMDGTMGNGYDTLFLWNQVHPCGRVYAFDVQETALILTRNRLRAAGWDENMSSVQLIPDSHHRLTAYISTPLTAAMFNLGYRPGSDKKIVTQWSYLHQALESLMQGALSPGGCISIISYGEHSGGAVEQRQLAAFLQNLPSANWAVTKFERINARREAPQLLFVEKLTEK